MTYDTYSASVLGLVVCLAGLLALGLAALAESKPARRRRPR